MIYTWRKRFGKLEPVDVRRLRQLEHENGRLKTFRTAAITLAGVELAHRIHKKQFSIAVGRRGGPASLKQLWERALAWTPMPLT